jgi:chemotaxis protein CheD
MGMNLFLMAAMTLSSDNDNVLPVKYLYPATLYAEREPAIVDTILGSCVAVCLFDPTLRVGAINHYMLPLWNGTGLASPKYGNIAIDKLFERMNSFGCKNHNIQAKIFGGGEVVETKINTFKIGQRNIEIAEQMLREKNISIVSRSVGGNHGRKIRFNTQTGVVLMKPIQKTI